MSNFQNCDLSPFNSDLKIVILNSFSFLSDLFCHVMFLDSAKGWKGFKDDVSKILPNLSLGVCNTIFGTTSIGSTAGL